MLCIPCILPNSRGYRKRRLLADIVLATLEEEGKEYRELDGNSLYSCVKKDGNCAMKESDGKRSWLGMDDGYSEVIGTIGT